MNNSHVFFGRIDIPRKEVEEGKEREREKERGGPLNEAKRVNLTVKQRLRSRKYRCFAAELQVGTIFLQFSRRFLCSLHFYLRWLQPLFPRTFLSASIFFLSFFFFTPQIVKRSISLAVKKKKIFEERKRSYRTRSLRNLSFSFREKKKEKKKKCEIGTRLVARAQAMTMKSNSYSSVRPKFPSLSPEGSYKLAVISKGRSQIRGVLSDWRQVFLGERVNLSKRM